MGKTIEITQDVDVEVSLDDFEEKDIIEYVNNDLGYLVVGPNNMPMQELDNKRVVDMLSGMSPYDLKRALSELLFGCRTCSSEAILQKLKEIL